MSKTTKILQCLVFCAFALPLVVNMSFFHKYLSLYISKPNQKNLIFHPVVQWNKSTCNCDRDYDIILVLGGGKPTGIETPPLWTQERADAAGSRDTLSINF